jgi:predicted AAA+ superfamily ATPase
MKVPAIVTVAKRFDLIVGKFTVKMTTMYTRLLQKPENSIFLFGPRGIGKSTWIRGLFGDAVVYDFLDSREAIRLERNPGVLFSEVESLPPGSWVVLDEVQKVPAVLNEVHRLIETRRLRFVLCGSSARKLKRGGANLLAGRAIVTELFPLTSTELGRDFDISTVLVNGTLPLAVEGSDPQGYLTTYTATYLNEEIRMEALTRNVGAFSRFLEIAARQNGQVTNISNVARDAAIARTTVQNYFDILIDTLIGYWVPAWKLKRSTKQISHPKFYVFDTGVARALSGRLPYPPSQEELGPLLENLIFNEIRAYLSYQKLHYQPSFWSSYDGTEVDFFCETRDGFVGVEIKTSVNWQKKFGRGLLRLKREMAPGKVKSYGVYRGNRAARIEDIDIFPVRLFLQMLWDGEIIR